jgi:transcription termination/antitermination protein NusA
MLDFPLSIFHFSMRASFIAAINQICAEKNVAPDQVLEAVKQAIATAWRKDHGNKEQEIRVVLREDQDMPSILLVKEVVESVENENLEISIKDAGKLKPDAEVGDEIEIDVTPGGYGRIAAQSAKQVILQKIQEAEKKAVYEMFKGREDELLTATVTKVEPNWVTLEIEGNAVSLPWREQIQGEHYYTGKRIRVYLDTVELTTKGPQLRISRTHPMLVKRLLELEIPEIRNGDVEIKAIARDAGFRSKVAVKSNDPRIDPIGACVGQKGVRIRAVMDELNGERVDMIEWSEDPIKLISTSLQPASISAVVIVNDQEYKDEDDRLVKKRAAVFVEEAQRPLAIGKKGQNIHLATQLSGFELDMYNYEELPKFQAKLAEIKGEAPLVTILVEDEESADGTEDAETIEKKTEDQTTEEEPAGTSAQSGGGATQDDDAIATGDDDSGDGDQVAQESQKKESEDSSEASETKENKGKA